MITERTSEFSFGVPRRQNHMGDWVDDFFSGGAGTPDVSDWSFELAPTDLFASNPSGSPYFQWPDLSLPDVTQIGGGVTTSPVIESGFDWSKALSGITQAAAALVPAGISIYKAATAEGQPAAGKIAPPGYMYNAQGQLVPLSATGAGGMSWVMIAALAAGAYFLAKK
jgi:hypothetical protein